MAAGEKEKEGQSANDAVAPSSQHREDTASEIHIASKAFMNKGDLELAQVQVAIDSTSDKSGRNGVALQIWTSGKFTDGKTENDEGRGDQPTHHGKAMLKPHDGAQEVWNFFIFDGVCKA